MTKEDIIAAADFLDDACGPNADRLAAVAKLLREISPAFNPPQNALQSQGCTVGTLITDIPQCVFLFPAEAGKIRIVSAIGCVRSVVGYRQYEIGGDIVSAPGGKFALRIKFSSPSGDEPQ